MNNGFELRPEEDLSRHGESRWRAELCLCSFSRSFSHPQKPFAGRNDRSTVNFDHSLQNTQHLITSYYLSRCFSPNIFADTSPLSLA